MNPETPVPLGVEAKNVAVFKDASLPGPFHKADQLAQRAQKSYISLTVANLSLLVVSAATFVYDFPAERFRQILAFLRAALLFLSFVLTLVLDAKKPDHAWREARYCAEQFKSMAWRYMTHTLLPLKETNRVLDADSELDPDDQMFTEWQSSLLSSAKLPNDVLGMDSEQWYITDQMCTIRKSALADRYSAYIQYRIQPQQEWYLAKFQANMQRERTWYYVMMTCQFVAIISAFLKGAYMAMPLDISGVLATLATAVLAWIQTRQYQRISRAYALAAQSLHRLQLQHQNVRSEDTLQHIVDQGEKIIGDEYREWRRRQETS